MFALLFEKQAQHKLILILRHKIVFPLIPNMIFKFALIISKKALGKLWKYNGINLHGVRTCREFSFNSTTRNNSINLLFCKDSWNALS